MSGHTAGPWTTGGQFDPNGPDPRMNVWGKALPGAQSGLIVAERVRPADATFILTACNAHADLLAALHLAADALADYSDVNDGQDGPTPNTAMSALQEIDAVIAKAEGKPR